MQKRIGKEKENRLKMKYITSCESKELQAEERMYMWNRKEMKERKSKWRRKWIEKENEAKAMLSNFKRTDWLYRKIKTKK